MRPQSEFPQKMLSICSSTRILLPLLAFVATFLNLPAQKSEDPQSPENGDTKLLDMMKKLGSEDEEEIIKTIKDLALTGDLRLENFFELYRQGSIYIWEDAPEGIHPVVVNEETIENDDMDELAPLTHPITREKILIDGKQAQPLWDDLTETSPSRDLRKIANSSKFLIRLASPDEEIRMSGVKKSGDPPQNIDAIESLETIFKEDPVEKIRWTAKESLLLIRLANVIPDQTVEDQAEAIVELGKIKSMKALPRLKNLVKEINAAEVKPDGAETLIAASKKAIKKIEKHESFVGRFNNIFQGLSLGSVLILMALGLAITFGLMGVINMAHGELMMIGAYTTYMIQTTFNHTPDTPQDSYYLLAIPMSFFAAAIVGLIMEALVIRHLYRRPLESLLATWGIGLILIQVVRITFGDNIGVNAPTWARGGNEIIQDVILPNGRIFILLLCGSCVGLVYFLMNKTPLGLNMRATMQNRDMASALGVNTRHVDRMTFALGSGLAGVAGCAWTLIGGVTPDMGQTNFIVDSFLVVVTGGVGELAGVICSGLGIGLITKWIEPLKIGNFTVGAIWAKVILLAIIVGFIQFKPAGLFAPKGRMSDV
jgi:urea transport system permease protein